ncbi:MAG: M12 family metallopeptidase [Mucilaginibacter sp.]
MNKRTILYFLIFSAIAAGCSKTAEVAPEKVPDDTQLKTLFAVAPKMCINKIIDADGKKTNGVVLKNNRWPESKKVIRVKFLNGDSYLQGKVMTYAGKWSLYGNVTFVKESVASKSDIRVAFKFDGDEGSWSYIGSDAQYIDKAEPTMNFGWFDSKTSEEEFSRVIIHEVGHAIGLAHEQASPGVNIKWNKNNVYWYYQRPPNSWTKAQIDYNIFFKYTAADAYYSPFDPISIMQYPVDPRFTTDGKTIGWNTVLSPIDKIVASRLFPK